MLAESADESDSTRSVALSLNGGKVSEGFRSALFDAAGREGVSVNQFVLEAAGWALRSNGYEFPCVFPGGDHKSIFDGAAK